MDHTSEYRDDTISKFVKLIDFRIFQFVRAIFPRQKIYIFEVWNSNRHIFPKLFDEWKSAKIVFWSICSIKIFEWSIIYCETYFRFESQRGCFYLIALVSLLTLKMLNLFYWNHSSGSVMEWEMPASKYRGSQHIYVGDDTSRKTIIFIFCGPKD